MILLMVSRHANPALTTRPDRALRDAALNVLEQRNRQVEAFIAACLATLVADPDGFLATLDPQWPPPRPRGRPRKQEAPPTAVGGAS